MVSKSYREYRCDLDVECGICLMNLKLAVYFRSSLMFVMENCSARKSNMDGKI